MYGAKHLCPKNNRDLAVNNIFSGENMHVKGVKSLREECKRLKIWEPGSWEEFLKQLMEFYEYAWLIYQIGRTLHQNINGKKIAELDQDMQKKIITCLYGGGRRQNSFARLMYDKDFFGIHAKNIECSESIPFEQYFDRLEKFSDNVLNLSVGVVGRYYAWGYIVDCCSSIISDLSRKLGKDISDIFMAIPKKYKGRINRLKDFIYQMLPNPSDRCDELLNIVNHAKELSLKLAYGVNPFTTFAQFISLIRYSDLESFLDYRCDKSEIIKLVEFLDLGCYDLRTFRPLKEDDILKKEDFIIAQPFIPITDKLVGAITYLLWHCFSHYLSYMKHFQEDSIRRNLLSYKTLRFTPWKDWKIFFKELKWREEGIIHCYHDGKVGVGYSEEILDISTTRFLCGSENSDGLSLLIMCGLLNNCFEKWEKYILIRIRTNSKSLWDNLFGEDALKVLEKSNGILEVEEFLR
ncbi:MAG: hypothetical protein ACTSXX_02205 [Candidatus Baldrarchaeia archaeon]